jgi:hypothetical protein
MRSIVVCALFVMATLLAAGPAELSAEPARGPVAAPSSGSLLDFLPESTLAALELHDVGRRWSTLRAIPAIAGFQNRLLHGSGLEPDDLPRLVGDRAALALVPTRGGRSVIPVAVLRPPDFERAEAILDVRAGARSTDGPAWCRVHGRGLLWVGPASAAGDVEAVARGDGTSLSPLLPFAEAERRLPAGGLVRGWVNPQAVRRYLQGLAPDTLPAPIEMISAAVAAEFEAARWIGFRRDIIDDRLVTDAIISFDRAKLPAEVVAVFDPEASAPLLPEKLPDDVVYATAYRLEAQSWLPWLRYLQNSDPRGPYRNLDFWIAEFEAQNGPSVEHDLIDTLGEYAWEIMLESRDGDSLQWAMVMQAADAERLEATLLELIDWSAAHAGVRSFGLARVRLDDLDLGGRKVHALKINTFLGELSGPTLAATKDHFVIGIGERAVRTALDLVDAGAFPRRSERGREWPAQMTTVIHGPALARTLESLISTDCPMLAALIEMLPKLGEASFRVHYESDGMRVHGEIEFTR